MTITQDDWDAHWSNYGDTSGELNPANRMRERIILDLLGKVPAGSTIVDIGSGQGDLAFLLAEQHPGVRVLGVEYSSEGVARARRRATETGSGVSFLERNLLEEVTDADRSVGAQYAVCSEVLEHVDEPAVLLQNAAGFLASGCRLVITVPGGPRSAFDRHIGHRRHFTPALLANVIRDAGLEVVKTERAGFPFFNLYKLLVIARGEKLIADIERGDAADSGQSSAARAVLVAIDRLLRFNAPPGPFGWQVVGIARKP
jgi:2-polyprenyl-3-methyl-5-hydroxy-6-metoxy-1,4-benzoquinol methylase